VDGNIHRDPNSTLGGGDYVSPSGYTFAQLGGDLMCTDRTLTLYIEAIDIPFRPPRRAGQGVRVSLPGQTRIEIELDPDRKYGGSSPVGLAPLRSRTPHPWSGRKTSCERSPTDFGVAVRSRQASE
jgi:hypothetical protein